MKTLISPSDIKILVCCHKDDYFHSGECFIPIHVGSSIAGKDLEILKDNTGDNISDRNPNYCELTAHYWLWKNAHLPQYVGLNHYRRYFLLEKKLPYGSDSIEKSRSEMKYYTFNIKKLNEIFSKYDIILAKRKIYPYSLEFDYRLGHITEDLRIMESVLKDIYPDYLESYNRIMYRNNKLALYNMFIMKRDEFEKYSEWLFNILFETEKRVKISSYPVQARIFGYMSERLLNVYVAHNSLRIHYTPIVKVVDRPRVSNMFDKIKRMLVAVKFNMLAKFTYSNVIR